MESSIYSWPTTSIFDSATALAPGERPSCMWKGIPVMCGPRGLPWAKNVLYHNLGNGLFEDVRRKRTSTRPTGITGSVFPHWDYDDDGWPDIYVACDSTGQHSLSQQSRRHVHGCRRCAGAAFNDDGREQAGMGSTVGDYDGDGKLDLFKTNFSDDTSTLYRNNGDGTFDDKTFPAGFGMNTQYLGWGVMFADSTMTAGPICCW